MGLLGVSWLPICLLLIQHGCWYQCAAFCSIAQYSDAHAQLEVLKHRAKTPLRFLEVFRMCTVVSTTANSLEGKGIMFPKGMDYETLWFAPELAPDPDYCSSRYICFFFGCLRNGCLRNYPKVYSHTTTMRE